MENEEVEECLCQKNYTDDICIIKNENGNFELQFWGWESYWDDDYHDCDYIEENGMNINYCPICGKNLKMQDLKNRAKLRKNRSDLRHKPNETDIKVANQNAKELESEIYKAIKE